MREAVKRHVLGRPKLRQSWNKYNLYNIHRFETLVRSQATFFQQKWAAKSMTRPYHGEHVNEKRWTRLFSRRLASVVEMPPEYLAAHDGAEQALGRGSGRELDPEDPLASAVTAETFSAMEHARQRQLASEDAKDAQKTRAIRPGPRSVRSTMRRPVQDITPYMQMAFAPLERRLEVAMFRAMFASSPRQARQFCVHGAVKVNGKKMRYGSYMLNPGDLFEVDPDKVLYATGKDKSQASLEATTERLQEQEEAKAEAEEEAVVETTEDAEAEGSKAKSEAAAEAETAPEAEEAPEEPELSSLPQAEREAEQRRRVRALVKSAKTLLAESTDLNAKRKQELRTFTRAARSALGKSEHLTSEDLMEDLASNLRRFKISEDRASVKSVDDSQSAPAPEKKEGEDVGVLSGKEMGKLGSLLKANEVDDENPVDDSKPYATPWQPRKFLAPFAFIPRYLEVNQNVCAAVYLRHPVARKGLAEVPTPFPYDVNQLAYIWYLRRR